MNTPLLFDLDDFIEGALAKEDGFPFEETLVVDARNRLTLIFDTTGGKSQRHFHINFEEWWLVLRGKFIWETQPYYDNTSSVTRREATVGNLMYVPRYYWHQIHTVEGPTVRLAVASPEAPHIYGNSLKAWVDDEFKEIL
jgi:oxalate decarboxylase/phosphoglucose isomerase-like protein (cupin superfamily)